MGSWAVLVRCAWRPMERRRAGIIWVVHCGLTPLSVPSEPLIPSILATLIEWSFMTHKRLTALVLISLKSRSLFLQQNAETSLLLFVRSEMHSLSLCFTPVSVYSRHLMCLIPVSTIYRTFILTRTRSEGNGSLEHTGTVHMATLNCHSKLNFNVFLTLNLIESNDCKFYMIVICMLFNYNEL